MEPAWIATIGALVINIFGWGATWGKLNGRVKSLEDCTGRHEKLLNNGLVDKLSETSNKVASLDATLKTYMELEARKSKGG
jgi:hypothetical protein